MPGVLGTFASRDSLSCSVLGDADCRFCDRLAGEVEFLLGLKGGDGSAAIKLMVDKS